MKVTLVAREFAPDRYKGWHVLTAAGAGASSGEVEARARNAPELPASVTALPPWLICDHGYARTPIALEEFRTYLALFIEMNRTRFHASKVVINLGGAPRPLPSGYVEAIEDVFLSKALHGSIREVKIYTDLA
ncbi:MAG: hypothetical protein IPP91_08745 [Betaproteobacteria bacterium]|nr:hypothetical protein [Betaproteobacteria bacterium]